MFRASTLTIDVPWWAIETGARVLRIDVPPFEGEQTLIDNHVDIGVDVAVTRSTVLVFDARPSWSSTFVRRAIEDDRRFAVGYRARLAPALSAGTANGRLDVAALDLASTVVIGGVDALTASDVALLEQFVRVRGGTLVLLPERAPAGPWSGLLAGSWTGVCRRSRMGALPANAARGGCRHATVLALRSHVDRRLRWRGRSIPAHGAWRTATRSGGFDNMALADARARLWGKAVTAVEEPLSARLPAHSRARSSEDASASTEASGLPGAAREERDSRGPRARAKLW